MFRSKSQFDNVVAFRNGETFRDASCSRLSGQAGGNVDWGGRQKTALPASAQSYFFASIGELLKALEKIEPTSPFTKTGGFDINKLDVLAEFISGNHHDIDATIKAVAVSRLL